MHERKAVLADLADGFVTSGFVRDRRDLPCRCRLGVEPDVAVGGSKE